MKKAITPIFATGLLLIIAIIGVISFQNWYNSYYEEYNNYTDIYTEENTLSFLLCLDSIFNTQYYYELKYNMTRSYEDYMFLSEICHYTVFEQITFEDQIKMIEVIKNE